MGVILLSKQQIATFLRKEFPQTKCTVEAVADKSATIRHKIGFDELRPGGTVSGPVMMSVADVAIYVAILGELGLVSLAVTSNLTINFLSKPSPDRDIIAQCRLLKIGKSQVVGEVSLFSAGDPNPVAHVVATYAIPPTTKTR